MKALVRDIGMLPRAAQWALLIAAGLCLTLVLRQVNFPAASLIGPVLASTVLGVRGATVRVPSHIHRLGQGVTGCLIAQYLSPEILSGIADHWLAVLTFVSLTFLIACFVGWLVGMFGRMDPEVAIWGFLPGMAGTMIAMSHERGLDSRVVAFVQILRVVAVILSVAVLSRAISSEPPIQPGASVPVTNLGLMATAAMCLLAVFSGRYLTFIPAAATLVPMTAAAVLNFSGLAQPSLPGWLMLPAYLILGSQVGLRFTPTLIASVARSFWAILGGVILLLLLCMVSGAVLATIVGETLLTGILSTIPGSLETVALITVNTHANLSFVMTLQVVRLFAVVLIGPFLANWMTNHLPGVRPHTS